MIKKTMVLGCDQEYLGFSTRKKENGNNGTMIEK